VYVFVSFLKPDDPFGRRNETNKTNVRRPSLLEDIYGQNGRASSGQHGIDKEYLTFREFIREAIKVCRSSFGVLVSSNADVTYLGSREQLSNAIGHAESSAKNRHYGKLFTGQTLLRRPTNRCFNVHGL
jgi:hypothetical protein